MKFLDTIRTPICIIINLKLAEEIEVPSQDLKDDILSTVCFWGAGALEEPAVLVASAS